MSGVAGKINGIRRFFPENIEKKRNYYLIFTAVFLITSLMMFIWLFLSGKTMVWNLDGYTQHFKAYEYWGEYLRKFVRGIFADHQFGFQEWDFALGEGSDVLQTLQFYVIGDPFALLMAVVPRSMTVYAYEFLMFARIYLAGILFSKLCFYTSPKTNRWGVLVGATAYSFGMWSIINLVRHPFFLNPLVFFPWIILGIEKILKNEKKRTFILAVFVAALGNFYFFYNLVLLTVIYTLVRLIWLYRKKIGTIVLKLLQIAGSAILGTAMAAAIVLPTVLTYLADSRTTAGSPFEWIYGRAYYEHLLGNLLGGNVQHWLCIGIAAPCLVAIILLLTKRKEHTFLKLLLLISAVIIAIPAIGQVFNGMSYISNRWSWAFGLLAAFVLAVLWEDMMRLSKREFGIIAISFAVCIVLLLILKTSRLASAFAGLAVVFVVIICLIPGEKTDESSVPRWKPPVILGLTVLHVLLFALFSLEADWENYNTTTASEMMDSGDLDDTQETEIVKVQAIEDGITTFYRYAGGFNWNEHTAGGLSNPGYYWSVSNPAISEFLRKMGVLDASHKHWGHDMKTAILTTGTVQYYLTDEANNTSLPYGFEQVKEIDRNEAQTQLKKQAAEAGQGHELTEKQQENLLEDTADMWYLYKNKYTLPLGYYTSNVIPEETWQDYNFVQRQECMLQGILLGSDTGKKASYTPDFDSKVLDYEIEYRDINVSGDGKSFTVTKPDASVALLIQGTPDSELYVNFTGLKYEGYSEYDLYFGDQDKDPMNLYTEEAWDALSVNEKENIKRKNYNWSPGWAIMSFKNTRKQQASLEIPQKQNIFYTGQEDYSVNFGYSKPASKWIVIHFSKIGKYTFDNMEVVAFPMKNYASRVKQLKKYPFRNVVIDTDQVTGSITAPEDGMLTLAIPYGDGWDAYVDGEKTEILRSNIKYMAVPVKKGDHDIKLVYHTPYLREGMKISAVAIAVFFAGSFALFLFNRRKKKMSAQAGDAGTETAAEAETTQMTDAETVKPDGAEPVPAEMEKTAQLTGEETTGTSNENGD